MYHDLAPPPPIPLKLKPKTLKKLSQQAVRGPLYLIVPTRPPHNMHHQMPPPPPPPPPPPQSHQSLQSHQSRNYAIAGPSRRNYVIPIHLASSSSGGGGGGSNSSNGSPGSMIDSLMSTSSSAALLDSHSRFRPEKFNMRPRVQQFAFMHGRNGRGHHKTSANWVRQLTSDDDVEEEEEEDADKADGAEAEARANSSRPEYQPSRLVGEIQLSSRVASMTIADVSPRFALKVSFKIIFF